MPYRSRAVKGHFQELGEGRYPRLSEFVPDVPPAFEAVVSQAMARQPSERFASARDLGRALLPFASFNSQRKWSEHYTSHKIDYFPAELPRGAAVLAKPASPAALQRTEKLEAEAHGPPSAPTVKTGKDETPVDPLMRAIAEGAPIPEYRADFEKRPSAPSRPVDKSPERASPPSLAPTRQLSKERLQNPWGDVHRGDESESRKPGGLRPPKPGTEHQPQHRPAEPLAARVARAQSDARRNQGQDWRTVLIFVLVPLVGILLALLLLR